MVFRTSLHQDRIAGAGSQELDRGPDARKRAGTVSVHTEAHRARALRAIVRSIGTLVRDGETRAAGLAVNRIAVVALQAAGRTGKPHLGWSEQHLREA